MGIGVLETQHPPTHSREGQTSWRQTNVLGDLRRVLGRVGRGRGDEHVGRVGAVERQHEHLVVRAARGQEVGGGRRGVEVEPVDGAAVPLHGGDARLRVIGHQLGGVPDAHGAVRQAARHDAQGEVGALVVERRPGQRGEAAARLDAAFDHGRLRLRELQLADLELAPVVIEAAAALARRQRHQVPILWKRERGFGWCASEDCWTGRDKDGSCRMVPLLLPLQQQYENKRHTHPSH